MPRQTPQRKVIVITTGFGSVVDAALARGGLRNFFAEATAAGSLHSQHRYSESLNGCRSSAENIRYPRLSRGGRQAFELCLKQCQRNHAPQCARRKDRIIEELRRRDGLSAWQAGTSAVHALYSFPFALQEERCLFSLADRRW